MKNLLTACVIVLGVLFVYGFIRGERRERMEVRVLVEPRLITASIYLPDVSDRYRFLSVYGCPVEITETGTFCTGEWERESTQEIQGYKQYLFTWRDLPGGSMRVTAMAFDADHKVVAQGQKTVFRGQ